MAMSRSLDSTSFTTRSSMAIEPPVMSSMPASMRTSVDLPQPDGPTSTMNSTSPVSNDMQRRASIDADRLGELARKAVRCVLNHQDGVWGGERQHGETERQEVIEQAIGAYRFVHRLFFLNNRTPTDINPLPPHGALPI